MANAIATDHHSSPTENLKVRRIRLFGQYLVDQGIVDENELREALDLLTAVNSTLGELAVERGYISTSEAEEINRLQHRIDRRWGDLALELGFGRLSRKQLDRLRDEQDARNLRLSDAIVELGFVSATEIDRLYRAYEDEAFTAESIDEMPPGYPTCPHVAAIVAVVPRVLRRMLRTPLRMSRPRETERPEGLDFHVGTSLRAQRPGQASLDIGLSACTMLGAAANSRVTSAGSVANAGATNAGSAGLVALLSAAVTQAQQSLDTADRRELATVTPARLPTGGILFDIALGLGEAMLVIERREVEPGDKA